MLQYTRLTIAGFIFFLVSCTSQPAADLILLNGRVWLSESDSFAEAVAIQGTKILAVGTSADIQKLAGKNTTIIDVEGKLVAPGFNDAHIHFLSGSIGLSEVEIAEAKSLTEVIASIKAFAKNNPSKKWITGRGWQYTMFPGGMPTKEFLDTLQIDRPIYLRAYDGHSALANSKALELAGVDRTYKFSGYGEIIRDARGNPTGALTEDAQSIVGKIVPPLSREEKLEALRKGMKLAASLGITSIQNASGSPEEFSLYQYLHQNNEMTVRTSTAFSVDENTTPQQIETYRKIRDSIPANDYIRANAVKFMLDGVIESHTAGMLDHYSDVTEHSHQSMGSLSMPLERYRELVTTFDKNGFQIYTHSIGDLAVRETLNAYEHAQQQNGTTTKRHRIEHIEMVSPDDIPRFAALGVLPSMEPIHAEPGTIAVWAKAVGEKRLPYSFAWASFLKSNAKLVFSSDWPACVSINPIRGLHTAVNRRTIDGNPPDGWVPEQKISMHDALYAYTMGGAYSSGEEHVKGKIKPGYLADIILFSHDLFSIDPMKTHETKVVLTIFDGKVIYQQ
ncbi:MAG: amidohydrolase [Cyclobacteriaceae bacterium]|nr:amidohydrolase [Cyclobacteriaceae bacterium]